MRGYVRTPVIRGFLRTRPRLSIWRSQSNALSSGSGCFVNAAFENFGLDTGLIKGLKEMGIEYPTHIQALAMEKMMQGADTVLAAETGSGKTFAYILPILHRILNEKRSIRLPTSSDNLPSEQPMTGYGDAGGPQAQRVTFRSSGQILHSSVESDGHDELPRASRSSRYAMVMCPSLDLCQQVQSMVSTLLEAGGLNDVTSELSPAGFSRYGRRPDVLLGTPGSIVATLMDMRKDIAHRILEGVGYLVVDEADMILTGSYRTQLDRLFRMLTAAQRTVAMRHLTQQLGITKEAFLYLPKLQRKSGIERGITGMIEAGYPHSTISQSISDRPFWIRQFVFAGATLPSIGGKNIKDDIAKLIPTAEVISTSELHKTSKQLTYDWMETTQDRRLEALLNIIQDRSSSFTSASSGSVLIFTRDSAAAERTSAFLNENGIDSLPYHKKLGGELRRANLQRFRKESGAIMVCTDGMSRGMDINGVTHVIQCDFAASAVAFLHRVGRTGRVGRDGHVTSLYTEADRELVTVIRDAVESGAPIEGAFSRNRSFRKKFRRYGMYVPRGATHGGRTMTVGS